jgi:hypothetical protein
MDAGGMVSMTMTAGWDATVSDVGTFRIDFEIENPARPADGSVVSRWSGAPAAAPNDRSWDGIPGFDHSHPPRGQVLRR